MTKLLVICLFSLMLVRPGTRAIAAQTVCQGGYSVIDCGGGKIIKCFDTGGTQVDCNDEFLDSKCEQAGIVSAPTTLDYSSWAQGIACPWNVVVACFTELPPLGDCVADTTSLVTCELDLPAAWAACEAAITSTSVGDGDGAAGGLVASCLPNPSAQVATVFFTLPHRSATRVEIFDSSGRALRTLLDRELEAGPKSIRWDGRDDLGESVASGTYFYRVRAGADGVVGRIVIVR